MHDQAPPTSPGAVAPGRRLWPGTVVLGLMIHGVCVLIACFIAPLAMNSNIWPIAGVFWSAFAVPAAGLTGALMGWLVKRTRQPIAISILITTGIALAIATGIIIANNR